MSAGKVLGRDRDPTSKHLAETTPPITELAQMETDVLTPHGVGQLPQSYRLGPYAIEGVIGKGGMGIVYRARAVASGAVPIDSLVALKMLNASQLDEADLRRFEREASYLQALRHPGIVRVLDIGDYEGRPYLVMQLVEGRTLDRILHGQKRQGRLGRLAVDEVSDLLTQALEALHVAHLAGIVHRDIKPGNIIVTDAGEVKILDFGMAHRIDVDSHLTATGSVLGTPAYMSPEQASGIRDLVDPRSDVYSIGAVCYELVCGRQAFVAENSMAMLRMIIEGDFLPPCEVVPNLGKDFETIILKAMAVDRRDRYQSAEAMAADLRRWRGGGRVQARRPGRLKKFLRRVYQHRQILAATALALFVIAIGVTVLVRHLIKLDNLRHSQRLEREQQRLESLTDAGREEVAVVEGPLAWNDDRFDRLPAASHGLEHVVFNLGSAPMHPRLQVRVDELGQAGLLELQIAAADVDSGYSLQLRRTSPQQCLLALYRGRSDAEEARRPRLLIKQIPITLEPGVTLALSREPDGFVRVTANGEKVMKFFDPLPIEGPLAAEAYLIGRPDAVRLSDLRLSRESDPKLVSAMRNADLVRQLGQYASAARLYRQLLAAETDPQRRRDLTYRLALCYAQDQNRLQEAIKLFDEVAENAVGVPEYALAATVQAWMNTIRLGNYARAEAYFRSIFDGHDLNEVLVSVPRDTLQAVPAFYIERAQAAAVANDLDQAIELYATAAGLAAHIEQEESLTTAAWAAAQLHLALDRFPEAAEHLRRLLELPQLLSSEGRYTTMLSLAHVERLMERDEVAIDLYLRIEQAEEASTDLREWARLWRGDLLWYQGEQSEAQFVWQGGGRGRTLANQVMRNLSRHRKQMPVNRGDTATSNDIAYFNAVNFALQGQVDKYTEQLENLLTLWPQAGEWPAPLARKILAGLIDSGID